MDAPHLMLVRRIEALAANAWPAAVVEDLDGWRLRFNDGVTHRANSVWPNETGDRLALGERLDAVESFYQRWGGPARYQLCPAAQPADLDAVLAERGYLQHSRTCVQTASLSRIDARAAADPECPVTVAERLPSDWLAVYCRAGQVRAGEAAARREILERIRPRTGYALLQLAAQPVAVGLGVIEEGWLGLFCMATEPTHRRRGAGTAVLGRLIEWGQQHGASRAYLQVTGENAPARALYTRLGFETLYCYHYRELAPARATGETAGQHR